MHGKGGTWLGVAILLSAGTLAGIELGYGRIAESWTNRTLSSENSPINGRVSGLKGSLLRREIVVDSVSLQHADGWQLHSGPIRLRNLDWPTMLGLRDWFPAPGGQPVLAGTPAGFPDITPDANGDARFQSLHMTLEGIDLEAGTVETRQCRLGEGRCARIGLRDIRIGVPGDPRASFTARSAEGVGITSRGLDRLEIVDLSQSKGGALTIASLGVANFGMRDGPSEGVLRALMNAEEDRLRNVRFTRAWSDGIRLLQGREQLQFDSLEIVNLRDGRIDEAILSGTEMRSDESRGYLDRLSIRDLDVVWALRRFKSGDDTPMATPRLGTLNLERLRLDITDGAGARGFRLKQAVFRTPYGAAADAPFLISSLRIEDARFLRPDVWFPAAWGLFDDLDSMRLDLDIDGRYDLTTGEAVTRIPRFDLAPLIRLEGDWRITAPNPRDVQQLLQSAAAPDLGQGQLLGMILARSEIRSIDLAVSDSGALNRGLRAFARARGETADAVLAGWRRGLARFAAADAAARDTLFAPLDTFLTTGGQLRARFAPAQPLLVLTLIAETARGQYTSLTRDMRITHTR